MTFMPHYRLTWSGTLPDGEIWSNTCALRPDIAAWDAELDDADREDMLATQLHAGTFPFDDVVADVQAYHSRSTTGITSSCVLKTVRLAAIDTDGHYLVAPRESAVTTPGFAGAGVMAFQVAIKTTLETDGDLGRVKGGWYIPLPTSGGWDPTTNLWGATQTSDRRDSVKTFIDALNNGPGADLHPLRVVIASQGRHNKNGTVKFGPALYDVKRVNVGRRADIIRSRASALSEARLADALIA